MSFMDSKETNYCDSILLAQKYLLDNYEEFFVIGQGLWSPWYVGNTMKDLEKIYGKKRIIDTPVSESATTGAAVGASLSGMKPLIVHPRMDFMLYAMDSIINQAAKWSYMFGGKANAGLTIRGIINRGGEQGAQHSQALHSVFAHFPGLRVVMPSTPTDARDLLIASALSKDPVIYIDDRWLYNTSEKLSEISELDLNKEKPKISLIGKDITLVGCGYTTYLLKKCYLEIQSFGIYPEIIDLRIINPLNTESIISSVKKTRRLLVVDAGWSSCSISSEIIAATVEKIPLSYLDKCPARITLPSCPAPTSKSLEEEYYFNTSKIIKTIKKMFK